MQHSVKLIQIKGRNVYNIRLEGFLSVTEMEDLKKQAEKLLRSPAANFRVLSDIRGFKPATPEVQEIMKSIQKMFKECGLKKVALLVDNALTKMQLKRLHGETGIRGTDEFFSADEEGYMSEIEEFLAKD